MMDTTSSEITANEEKTTGLPWPKTWNGAYALVIVHFFFWIALLLVLKELYR